MDGGRRRVFGLPSPGHEHTSLRECLEELGDLLFGHPTESAQLLIEQGAAHLFEDLGREYEFEGMLRKEAANLIELAGEKGLLERTFVSSGRTDPPAGGVPGEHQGEPPFTSRDILAG